MVKRPALLPSYTFISVYLYKLQSYLITIDIHLRIGGLDAV